MSILTFTHAEFIQYKTKMDELGDEITRLRAQIEQERAVQTRLNEEVDRLNAKLTEIEALK